MLVVMSAAFVVASTVKRPFGERAVGQETVVGNSVRERLWVLSKLAVATGIGSLSKEKGRLMAAFLITPLFLGYQVQRIPAPILFGQFGAEVPRNQRSLPSFGSGTLDRLERQTQLRSGLGFLVSLDPERVAGFLA